MAENKNETLVARSNRFRRFTIRFSAQKLERGAKRFTSPHKTQPNSSSRGRKCQFGPLFSELSKMGHFTVGFGILEVSLPRPGPTARASIREPAFQSLDLPSRRRCRASLPLFPLSR